jgi:hypothetical protein
MIRTSDIPRGHGTTPSIVDLIVEDPDTYRKYGRRAIRRWCSECPYCRIADRRRARLSSMHAAYRRRAS